MRSLFLTESVINGVHREDGNEQAQYKPDERPCPTCRGAITKEKLFARSAFEPTDVELDNEKRKSGGTGSSDDRDSDGDVEMIDDIAAVPHSDRVLRKRTPSIASFHMMTDDEGDEDEEEDDDDEDDDLSDFIVEDGESEADKDERRRARNNARRKGKARAIVLSDDEDDDIICGAKPDYVAALPPEQVKMLPKFLPSTKMKYMMEALQKWAESHPDEKVCAHCCLVYAL